MIGCTPVVINPSTEKYTVNNFRSYPLSHDQAMENLLSFFAKNSFEVEVNKAAGKIELAGHIHLYDMHQITGTGLQRIDSTIPELNTSIFKLGIADCGKGLTGEIVSPNLAHIKVNVKDLGQSSSVSVESTFRYTHEKIRPAQPATAVPNGLGGYTIYEATPTTLEGENIQCQSTGVIESLILNSIRDQANPISEAGKDRFVKMDTREHLPSEMADSMDVINDKTTNLFWVWSGYLNLGKNALFNKYSELGELDNASFVNEINKEKIANTSNWRQPTTDELLQLSSVLNDGISLTKRGWLSISSTSENGTNKTDYLVFFPGNKQSLKYFAARSR